MERAGYDALFWFYGALSVALCLFLLLRKLIRRRGQFRAPTGDTIGQRLAPVVETVVEAMVETPMLPEIRAMSTPTRFSPADMATWPVSPSGLSRVALSNADIEVRHYAPKGHDPQTPHDRDELYFVISGNGQFERNGVWCRSDRRRPVRRRRRSASVPGLQRRLRNLGAVLRREERLRVGRIFT